MKTTVLIVIVILYLHSHVITAAITGGNTQQECEAGMDCKGHLPAQLEQWIREEETQREGKAHLLELHDDPDLPPQFYAFHDDQGRLVGSSYYVFYTDNEEALIGVLYRPPPAEKFQPDVKRPLENFSGTDVAFIYPDFETCLVGAFAKGDMISARQTRVVGFDRGVQFAKFEPDVDVFRLDWSTKTSMSSQPLLRDPYEQLLVEITDSTLANAGQGVILQRSVANNTVVAYFNGVRLKEADVFNSIIPSKKSPYLVEIGDDDDYLDVPEEMSRTSAYVASSGHKVNHAKKANGVFDECRHPRFGRIHCFVTTKALDKGQELFSQYSVAFNKDGMKAALETALNLGHWFSGKSRSEFADDVRPYVKAASKLAESFRVDDILGMSFEQ